MLTGVTVMGQAKKCQEFEDRLRSHHIRERFGGDAGLRGPGQDASQGAPSIADELSSPRQAVAGASDSSFRFAHVF
jgi:hypothetical protein